MTTKELNKKKKETETDKTVKRELQEMQLTMAIMNKQIEELSKRLNIDTKPNNGYTKEDFDELASFYHPKK